MKKTLIQIGVVFGLLYSSVGATVTPAMVAIAADSFEMGNGKSATEGLPDERPVHTVEISAFSMGNFPVTQDEWDTVRSWAANHGYTDLPAGVGRGSDYPVTGISWYDAVKWCNARSEMESHDPVYFTTAGQTVVYRTGQIDLSDACVDWTADGYRLPTEAEWELAARGAYPDDGKRFPRADTLNHANGNYVCTPVNYDTTGSAPGVLPWTHPDHSPAYDASAETAPYKLDPLAPDYYEPPPYTSPIGAFPANGLGLYSMAGNVWELCWDWYDESYYSVSPGSDPRGPSSGTYRVLRGGSWDSVAFYARCSNRAMDGAGQPLHGFRVVRVP